MRFSFQLVNELPLEICFFIFSLCLFILRGESAIYQPIDFYQRAAPLTFWFVVRRSMLVLADFVWFEISVDRTHPKTQPWLFWLPAHVVRDSGSIPPSIFRFRAKGFQPRTYAQQLIGRYHLEFGLKVVGIVKYQVECTVLCCWDVQGKLFVVMIVDV